MNKTALITGASSGIGEAFARKLAAQGYDLLLVARSKDKLEVLAQELKEKHGISAVAIQADLSEAQAAAQVFQHVEQMGRQVDLLINNAGFGLSGEFLNHPPERYRQQIALNVAALTELTHRFLPGMVAKRSGSIINVASLLSFFPFPYSSVYSATKAYVLSFSESLWEEYRHHGVRMLAVCPGPTDTKFFQSARDIETGNKRTPEQVVDTAIRALDRGRSFVIDGSQNYMMSLLGRLLPRRSVVKMFGSAIRKSMSAKRD